MKNVQDKINIHSTDFPIHQILILDSTNFPVIFNRTSGKSETSKNCFFLEISKV